MRPMKSLMWMVMVLGMALVGMPAAMAAEADQDEAARNVLHRPGGDRPERQPAALLQRRAQGPRGAAQRHLHQLRERLPADHAIAHPDARKLVDYGEGRRLVRLGEHRPGARHARGDEGLRAEQRVDESRWLFLTGTKEDIDHILKKLKRYNASVEMHSTQMLAGTTRERHEWIPLPAGIQPDAIAAVLRSLAERPG